jgi:hypothetical protein
MSTEPVFFARPEGPAVELRVAPRLASWNAARDPDQLKLAAALNDADELLGPSLSHLTGPLALCLDVGLPDHISLLVEHDLDNYALPLAARLMKGRNLTLVSVLSTKAIRDTSLVRCERATPACLPPESWGQSTIVGTTASSSSTAYKEQISEQLNDAQELPPGPVALQLAFVVGPRRNWLNLWKPTIDALDRLLGRTYPNREWNPLDGRIAELGLHCTTVNTLRSDVVIAIAARSLSAGSPT